MELRGEMQEAELKRLGARWLRDVVSDADKLDALGLTGLRRLLHYNFAELRELGDEALADRLRGYCEQYVEHRAGHLVFEESRRRGAELLQEMREALRDPAAVAALRRELREGPPNP